MMSHSDRSTTSSSAYKARIAIIDDDREMRSLLEDFFSSQGFQVRVFNQATEALAYFRKGVVDVDVIISDIKMPLVDGLEFTAEMQKISPETPILLITAFGSIETAVEAIRKGAFHYVIKPFKLAEIAVHVDRALDHMQLRRDNSVLRQSLNRSWTMGEGSGQFLGKSAAMRQVFDLVERVSKVSANVLVTGESGTGKERVARAIHELGPRAQKPFVAINCTAIPETLLESELFGHAKGSFTGAIARKRGLFEEADGGTLFLDEIGDLNVSLQAKLLRVIQEKKIRPVGDNTTRDVDVRIIAATHKDLKGAIKSGLFREDLFYRLSVIPIAIPPLRDRPEDIPLLAEHFLKRAAAANRVQVRGFSPAAMARLMKMRWEGNVRELENLVERLVVLSEGALIEEKDVPNQGEVTVEGFFRSATQDLPTIDQLEARYMRLVLERTAGKKDKAAQILGINRRTLYRKEREYGFVAADAPVEEGMDEGQDQES
jgi:two-component system response regulator HydG